ncbi:LarC family nickel insertion protein [Alteribacillus sp. JSM 102045]|uniref:LarC family nickel insertion protein n=1 Tax=Alteribacillus sp. JSM 102045 TaxID=1562101 RepID=UPI0035BF0993
MRILYLDCSISGISGDMTLGALHALGADMEKVEKELKAFPIEAFSLKTSGEMKKGIYASKVDVIPEEEAHHHRHYSTICQMILDSDIAEKAKALSLQIFEPIAKAEAHIHHTTIDKVHFHEVGAVDSIVDVVGTALALDQLEIEEVFSSPVVLGNGKQKMAHGIYPIPAPAALEMMKWLPVQATDVDGELTTPTGAGILKGLVTSFGPIPSMGIESIGYGAGSKDFPSHPNVLRAILGEKK